MINFGEKNKEATPLLSRALFHPLIQKEQKHSEISTQYLHLKNEIAI